MRGKYSKILLPLIMAAVLLAGCQSAGDGPEDGGQKKDRYSGPYSAVNGSYAGVDDLGRALPGDQEASAVKSDKKVGIFYFLWPAAVREASIISGESRCSDITPPGIRGLCASTCRC